MNVALYVGKAIGLVLEEHFITELKSLTIKRPQKRNRLSCIQSNLIKSARLPRCIVLQLPPSPQLRPDIYHCKDLVSSVWFAQHQDNVILGIAGIYTSDVLG